MAQGQKVQTTNEPKKPGYTIGLDIGTASVGWAVIDNNFNLVKGKKRIIEIDSDGTKHRRKSRTNLWGVRVFDSGETAAGRRGHRSTRRRLARRTKRLGYLRAIFADEMEKVDAHFFVRLEESFYQRSDKANKKTTIRYPLFDGRLGAGETYNSDKAYYEEYPTIYHLRRRLVRDASQADLRLVYLALHHILKYRGNFLYEDLPFSVNDGADSIDVKPNFVALHEAFCTVLTEVGGTETVQLDEKTMKLVETALKNNKISNTAKAEALLDTVGSTDKKIKKQQKALYQAVVGNGINLATIFANDKYSEKNNKTLPKPSEFKYGNDKYEEYMSALDGVLTEQEVTVIARGKAVHSSMTLSQILTKPSLAESMEEKYKTHKKQLKTLRAWTKKLDLSLYDAVFKTGGYYDAYIRGEDNPGKRLTQETFYKQLKKALETHITGLVFPKGNEPLNLDNVQLTDKDKAILHELHAAIQLDQYLPKQRTNANGAIPYQIHEAELVEIIENQAQYYEFLKEVCPIKRTHTDGSVEEAEEYKIQILMKFRIPYYVGPLAKNVNWQRDGEKNLVATGAPSENSWLARKSVTKITPWNFDEVIDKEASAKNFIERMTGTCTYLPGQKVLPQSSLLYQEYTVYNELMTCGYVSNGKKELFSPELKEEIVEKLFKKYKKVTTKEMLLFLTNEKGFKVDAQRPLFGIDTYVKNAPYNASMSAYIDLVTCGIEPHVIDDHRAIFEDIIKWQTIFEDKTMLRTTITRENNENWGNLLQTEQINKLVNKHYTGWGRLSKRLLDEIKTENGKTIINHLKTEQYGNFMQVITNDTDIKGAIDEAQGKLDQHNELSKDVVDELAGSPALKKSIWQTIQVIKELEKYLGVDNIDRIVIEMARDDEGGRPVTRQKQIENYYKKAGTEIAKDLRTVFKEQTEAAFSDDKVFLYFLQNGKCMYTEDTLQLTDLSDCEIDHIIPQTYIKDDSFDNRVLVKRTANQNKGGEVPSAAIIAKMRPYWEQLAKNNQVSKKKLANLTRGRLTEKDKAGFINRQLVETRQITKHIANILTTYFKDKNVEILTPKAQLVSQFRAGTIYIEAHEAADIIREEPQLTIHAAKSDKFKIVQLHDNWYKNRELNDYHHAHDAYLCAVVATYLYGVRPDLRELWVYGSYHKDAKQLIGRYVGQRQAANKQLLSGMVRPEWTNELIDHETGEVYPCYPDVSAWSRDEVITKLDRILTLRNINIVQKTEPLTGSFGNVTLYKNMKNAQKAKKGKKIDDTFANGFKKHLPAAMYGGTKAPDSAFAVIVRTEKDEIKALSVPVMHRAKFGQAKSKKEKLNYLQTHIDATATAIVRLQMNKNTKYMLPDKTSWRMTSYQDTVSGSQVPMMKSWQQKTNEKEDTQSDELLLHTYHTLAEFIAKHKLFTQEKLAHIADDGTITRHFKTTTLEDKYNILNEMLRVTKGKNQKLEALAAAGLGTTSQQMRVKGGRKFAPGTQIVDQSVTGLYETRRKL